MTGFINKYVVLLISQKDYEHYLYWMNRLSVKKLVSKYIDTWTGEMIQWDMRFSIQVFLSRK